MNAHFAIGNIIPNTTDMLITVGLRAKVISGASLDAGMNKENINHFNNTIQAGEFIKNNIKQGDMVLIKGSQAMRMEKIVEMIMMYPEYKDQVLVRQEKEWLEKI